MKQKLLNSFKLRATLLVAILCSLFTGTAWGQTTVTQTSFSAISGNVNGDSNVSYSAYKGGGTSNPAVNSNAIRLYQDSGGNTAGYVVIGVAEGYEITSATIRSTMATTTGYKLTDSDPGSSTPEKNTFNVSNYSLSANTDYTVSDISTRYITFACFGTSSSSRLYLSKISITYQSSGGGSSAAATTTTIDASGITNTDVYTSTTAGSLSASVTSGGNDVAGATVTWSGDNDAVATINSSTGAVTLVAAGTVTFTASYNGVSGTYQASSDTYEMIVTSSAPYVQPTEIEITPNYTFWGQTEQFSGSTHSDLSGSKDNVSLAWSRGSGSTYANQNAMRFYKDNTLTFTAPTGYEIKSVELSVSGTYNDLSFSPSGWVSENTIWTGSSETVTMSRPDNASSYATISKFTITIGLPSTDPSISASNVNITYDATSGSIDYTLENATGNVTATVTDGNWLTLGTITSSAVPFTCSANPNNTSRTATVTLSFSGADDKVITITQAAAPVIYTTIPALFAAATSTSTDVNVTFGGWVVSAVHNNNAYLTDNQGHGLIIYASGHGFQVNDVLTGTVSCKLQTYNGSAELTNLTSSTTGLSVANNGTVTEQNIAISDLSGVNTGALLAYEGLTYNGTALVDGSSNTITPYNTLYSGTFENGKTYNVTGIYLQYNSTKEILPRSVDDIEEVAVTTPTITLASYSVEATATTGLSGTINVTYENITTVAADVAFYASDGTTSATYDWISVSINSSDNVEYLMDANDGAARTAYFKVWAYDDDMNEVYSNLVTITQAAYIAPAAPNNWVAANLADINANDVFVIVGNNGSDTYALSNDNGTGSAPSAVEVTVSGSTLSGTIADNIKWNISGNATDGYTFYPNGNTEIWLYCTNTNNGVRVGTNATNNTFTLDGESGYLNNVATSRYVGIYSAQDWRCYTNTTGNIAGQTFAFYKQLAAKLNGNGYATFSATVPVDFSDDSEYSAWVITDISGSTITFEQVTGTVPANTGVLLKGNANETVYPVVATSGTAPETNLLVSASTATDVEVGEAYGLSGDKFVVNNVAGTIPAGRAYLPAATVDAAGVKSFTLVFHDEATGITETRTATREEVEGIFNLAGQRMSKIQKGINIINGKKVLVK